VTTHWEDCKDLRHAFPGLAVREGVRWVEHERVITSAGVSAGLHMSLRIVARLAGQDMAERTARQMDYEWRQRESGTDLPKSGRNKTTCDLQFCLGTDETKLAVEDRPITRLLSGRY
jgi:transcriptional regulator GlxA family with amidase domain